MASEILRSESLKSVPTSATAPAQPRLWPALLLVVLFWSGTFITRQMELATVVRFGSRISLVALLTLGFLIWWLTNRRVQAPDLLLGVAALLASGAVAV